MNPKKISAETGLPLDFIDFFLFIFELIQPLLTIKFFYMKTGVIKFFNATKGYGFIKEDGTGTEVFVHITGLAEQPINQGDKVSFDITDGRKGPNAINVKKI